MYSWTIRTHDTLVYSIVSFYNMFHDNDISKVALAYKLYYATSSSLCIRFTSRLNIKNQEPWAHSIYINLDVYRFSLST